MTENNSYPKVAFCSAISPGFIEHYDKLRKAGIDTACVCLHLSNYNYQRFARIHTNLAREAGMITHAFFVTNLYDVTEDVLTFSKNFSLLGYTASSKITVLVNSDKYVPDREDKIIDIIDRISRFHPRENIDLAFFKRDLDDKLYDPAKLPRFINLTVISCEEKTSVSMLEAGTWVYTSDFENEIQLLAYDFYGFYTSDGYQLSLIDTDYVVQLGDTWHSIARRHGMPLNDLLALNRANKNEKIYAGQIVRIA